MKLDKDTYEAWLLDRMEGRLSAAQEAFLDAFLAEHPELPVDLGQLPNIDGDELHFPLKDMLRKAYPPTGEPDAARLDDFLVARLEKDLDAEQLKQLERFLYEHPETEHQAALMALAKLPAVPVPFDEKETIERYFPPKGMPDAHRLTDFLIAELEGDLSAEQQHALNGFVDEHANARREKMLVAATRTTASPIVFFGKEQLKKREGRVVVLWPRLAAAASIALLLGMGWWMLREKPEQHQEVARVEKPFPTETVKENPDLVTAGSSSSDPAETGNAVQPGAPTPAQKPNVPNTRPEPKPELKPLPKTPQLEEPTLAQKPEAPKAQPAPKPMPEILPHALQPEEPSLAQKPAAPNPETPAANAATPEENEPMAFADTRGTDQTLGAFLANTVRGDVLETPQRKSVLDGHDALAFADKAVGALTGGQGGVKVERNAGSERFQVRLGRNLSISASRGR
ncbi:MAG: hypothetical protein WAT61_14850 [Flavobacteriales bacterium]